MMRPQALGDVLAGMLADGELREAGTLLRLRGAWPEAAGAALAARSRPVAVRGGTIVIEVDHPVVGQELKLTETRVLDALRSKVAVDARRLELAVAGPSGTRTSPPGSGGRR